MVAAGNVPYGQELTRQQDPFADYFRKWLTDYQAPSQELTSHVRDCESVLQAVHKLPTGWLLRYHRSGTGSLWEMACYDFNSHHLYVLCPEYEQKLIGDYEWVTRKFGMIRMQDPVTTRKTVPPHVNAIDSAAFLRAYAIERSNLAIKTLSDEKPDLTFRQQLSRQKTLLWKHVEDPQRNAEPDIVDVYFPRDPC